MSGWASPVVSATLSVVLPLTRNLPFTMIRLAAIAPDVDDTPVEPTCLLHIPRSRLLMRSRG
jgi:hypothetical protein